MNEREHKIVNTLETYFSDASLLWDKIMVNKVINSEGGSKDTMDALLFFSH